jgi:hypothetical protein
MYAANCPVSRPVPLPQFPPDVDLNGIGFSYDIGLLYPVNDDGSDNRFVVPAPQPRNQ